VGRLLRRKRIEDEGSGMKGKRREKGFRVNDARLCAEVPFPPTPDS
jgi:hypothetical protein